MAVVLEPLRLTSPETVIWYALPGNNPVILIALKLVDPFTIEFSWNTPERIYVITYSVKNILHAVRRTLQYQYRANSLQIFQLQHFLEHPTLERHVLVQLQQNTSVVLANLCKMTSVK